VTVGPWLAWSTLKHCSHLQVLIFSTWGDVLELLHHALTRQAIPHIYGKGKHGLAKALASFCTMMDSGIALEDVDVTPSLHAAAPHALSLSGVPADVLPTADGMLPRRRQAVPGKRPLEGEPRVLLLLLKQAAAGLNLTEAQHAILVEPSINPATEAQVRPCVAVLPCIRGHCLRTHLIYEVLKCMKCSKR
jgi:hypothetical protein